MKRTVAVLLLAMSAPIHAETLTITSAEYGDEWPFTVDRVTLSWVCSR